MKLGIALSGGGARGGIELGILYSLVKRYHIKIDVITGTSIGAIIGGIYASGMEIEDMINFLYLFEADKYLKDISLLISNEKGIRKRLNSYLKFYRSINLLTDREYLDDGEKILELLKVLTKNKDFEDCEIRFGVNAVDLISGKEVYLTKGRLYKAMRASMSIPGIFKPVEMDGMLLVDGGTVCNVPVSLARKLGAEKVIAIDLRNKEELKDFSNGFEVLWRAGTIAAKHITDKELKKADHVIEIPTDIDILDFDRMAECLELGMNYDLFPAIRKILQ